MFQTSVRQRDTNIERLRVAGRCRAANGYLMEQAVPFLDSSALILDKS
jgi:hypothetical protein